MNIEELQAKIKTKDEALKIEKAKVNEFRNNNLALNTSVEALNAKIKGVDFDEYSTLKKNAQEMKDKEMISAGKVGELVDEKVKKIRTEQVEKMKELQENNANLSTELNAQVVGSAVKTASIKAGIVGTAIDDVLMRANSVWTVKDGKPVALNKDGNTIWLDGTTEPLTLDKWVESLNDTAPHLFGESKGTGAKNAKYDANTKTMTRQSFDAISQKDRSSFFKDGGKLTD